MMNLMGPNKSIASVLIDKKDDPTPYAKEDKEPSGDEAEIEVIKELISAIKENKPMKAKQALSMFIEMCYDESEEKEE